MRLKFFSVTLLLFILSFSAQANAEIRVTVDGEQLYFGDAAPVIINDRTYVPLRAVFESLGAYVEWDQSTKTVFAHKRLSHITMSLNDGVYYVNSEQINMVAPPVIREDRMLIPVRDISNALGADISWDQGERKVIINSPVEEYDIEDLYLEFWKKHEDNIIITGVAAYPNIKDDGSIFEAFNAFMLGETEDYSDEVMREYYEDAVNLYSDNNSDEVTPFMFERHFDVTYDSDSVLCILFYEEVSGGGQTPSVSLEAVTYNMDNGELISVTDILKETAPEIRKKVRNSFLERINSEPDKFYHDAIMLLDSATEKLNWYLADDGVHFFINPSVIAPVSQGVVEVVI